MSLFECPSYHFQVDWGGSRNDFSEVSGLNILIDTISHREGANLNETTSKIPGMITYSNIILKRPVRKNDNEFFEWINTKRLGTAERRDVTVKLLNEDHSPVVIWKVKNSFPVRYSGPVLRGGTSEIAMEELELAHEGLTVETV
ncbi:MAG TPA: phage tail protein [Ignavibacteria bacterium]|nr:phage tail protein [Bacteroidota bacterium]HRI85828.1 phage tail protein [Ignavibacteria bacterium]HRJ98686.1 phage tail protein [Ignavibacteria bacterium]